MTRVDHCLVLFCTVLSFILADSFKAFIRPLLLLIDDFHSLIVDNCEEKWEGMLIEHLLVPFYSIRLLGIPYHCFSLVSNRGRICLQIRYRLVIIIRLLFSLFNIRCMLARVERLRHCGQAPFFSSLLLWPLLLLKLHQPLLYHIGGSFFACLAASTFRLSWMSSISSDVTVRAASCNMEWSEAYQGEISNG